MFQSRIASYIADVAKYEDEERKALGLSILPLERINAEAEEAVEIAKEFEEKDIPDFEDCLLESVLLWFKRDFFTWVDKPPCWNCTNTQTQAIGIRQPSPEEAKHGASRTENYQCPSCAALIAFPRYNDPLKLLETRKGRCGEWANVFTFLCRCLDLDVRYVVDWTDHVWTEHYSKTRKRWVHVDCCESIMDRPLLYESGWGKKLTYVIAIDRYGAVDVTRRYTNDWNVVLGRRSEISENQLDQTLKLLTAQQRAHLASDVQERLRLRDLGEQEELLAPRVRSTEALPGRLTGSAEWRQGRGETGSSIKEKRPLRPAQVRYKRLPKATKNTNNSLRDGIVRCSGENPPHEVMLALFDGRLDTKWLDFGGGTVSGSAWVEFCLPKAQPSLTIGSYGMVSAPDAVERDPAEWEVQVLMEEGSEEWKTVDRQKDIVFASRSETLLFEIKHPVPCRRIRLCIWKTRDPHKSNSLQLGQWQLFPQQKGQEAASSANTREAFQAQFRKLFDAYIHEGKQPNEAASAALEQLRRTPSFPSS